MNGIRITLLGEDNEDIDPECKLEGVYYNILSSEYYKIYLVDMLEQKVSAMVTVPSHDPRWVTTKLEYLVDATPNPGELVLGVGVARLVGMPKRDEDTDGD